MSMLLLQANATVTTAHSKTKDLERYIAESEIIVAALGRAKAIGSTYRWRKDATIIDVGINRGADGKLCGDVDFESIEPVVSAITPVPGGVGPMTIALLMANTVLAACRRQGLVCPQELQGMLEC